MYDDFVRFSWHAVSVLLVVAVAIFQLSGCSIIGARIGAVSDASSPDQITIPVEKVETIKPGTQIDILLNDGGRISGEYAGLDCVPDEEYAQSYAKSREQNREEVILPALGDSITIKQIYGFLVFRKKLKGEFLGFDYETILVRQMGRTKPSTVNLNTVRKIVDSDGNVVEAETLRKLMAEGKLSLLSALSAIFVQSEGRKTRVAMDKVYQIQIPVSTFGKHAGALIGFLFGATVDISIVLGLASWDGFGGFGVDFGLE